MPHRFNYTDRQKIERKDASFTLTGEGADLRFDAELALADYKLDPTARVYVEAYRGASALQRRFEYGRVGAPVVPKDRSLAEFQVPAGILFRVKVTADGEGGARLFAKADQIGPKATDEDRNPAQSLLATLTKDLEGEAWKLDFTDELPLLLVDPKVGGAPFAQTPAFRLLAAPMILRDILVRFMIVEGREWDDGDETGSHHRWLAFAKTCTGEPCPDLESDSEDVQPLFAWIDSAVAGFARKARLIDLYLPTVASEDAP